MPEEKFSCNETYYTVLYVVVQACIRKISKNPFQCLAERRFGFLYPKVGAGSFSISEGVLGRSRPQKRAYPTRCFRLVVYNNGCNHKILCLPFLCPAAMPGALKTPTEFMLSLRRNVLPQKSERPYIKAAASGYPPYPGVMISRYRQGVLFL